MCKQRVRGELHTTASKRSVEVLHYLITASVMMKSNSLKITFSMLSCFNDYIS